MNNRGFTLIEIMIVLVIIAVMSAVVTLNVGAPNYSRFLGGVEKLSGTFSILADEAIYTSSVVSCSVSSTKLNCRLYRDGEWQDIEMRRLVSWGWPNGIKVSNVLLNGVPLKEKQEIRFLPSGDNGGLSVEVTDGTYTAWIDSDLVGHFKISS